MASVVTTAGMVVCSHQATATLTASQSKLKAGGSAVLLATDIVGATIAACTNVGTGLTPCSTVVSLIAGQSTKLTIGSQPVLLDSATGPTNGFPAATWSVKSAGQSVLTAT
jgi:hypothetical protein